MTNERHKCRRWLRGHGQSFQCGERARQIRGTALIGTAGLKQGLCLGELLLVDEAGEMAHLVMKAPVQHTGFVVSLGLAKGKRLVRLKPKAKSAFGLVDNFVLKIVGKFPAKTDVVDEADLPLDVDMERGE